MDAPTARGLALVVPALHCPICADSVTLEQGVVVCARGHRFDIARQGYVSLLPGGSRAVGDTVDMVAARQSFLDRGHYDPISESIGRLLPDRAGLVVDAGGGTGHHLARILDARPGLTGLVIDSSAAAARRAARAHARIAAVVADVWAGLPLADGAAVAVLSVFAPRNAEEVRRVLDAGGIFVVVTPTADHLGEVVAPLGMVRVDARKRERLATQLEGFAPVAAERIVYELRLDRAALRDEVLMGPSAHHVDRDALESALVALAEPITVTVAVDVAAYRPH